MNLLLQILVGGGFVSAIAFFIFRTIKKNKLPSNEYTPFDDIQSGRKRDD